jgi:hypothetical protein
MSFLWGVNGVEEGESHTSCAHADSGTKKTFGLNATIVIVLITGLGVGAAGLEMLGLGVGAAALEVLGLGLTVVNLVQTNFPDLLRLQTIGVFPSQSFKFSFLQTDPVFAAFAGYIKDI